MPHASRASWRLAILEAEAGISFLNPHLQIFIYIFFLFIFKLVVFSLHQSPIFHTHDSLWSHRKKAPCHLFQIYIRTPERSGLKFYHVAFPTRGLYVGGLPRYILAVYTFISSSVLFNRTCFAKRERIWCYITPVNALIDDATSPIYFTPTHAVVLFKLVHAPGCCYVIVQDYQIVCLSCWILPHKCLKKKVSLWVHV